MKRSLSLMIVTLCGSIGCVDGAAEPAFKPSSPAAFAGAWRSATPSLEFIRLTVTPQSNESSVLGARLTFSGVAWEGGGRIEGDSLVSGMTIVGSPTASGVIVARARDVRTLGVQFRSAAASPLELTFIREN